MASTIYAKKWWDNEPPPRFSLADLHDAIFSALQSGNEGMEVRVKGVKIPCSQLTRAEREIVSAYERGEE